MRPLEPGMPGVLAVRGRLGGDRRAIAECADCGRPKIIKYRGLCDACARRHRRAGTIGDWGWTKADRFAEYAGLLPRLGPAEAAARVGVSRRTAHRYEAALRELRAS